MASFQENSNKPVTVKPSWILLQKEIMEVAVARVRTLRHAQHHKHIISRNSICYMLDALPVTPCQFTEG